MANRKKIVQENVDGDFFVDTTCIDCDTCRQIAPDSFDDAGDYSFVYAQPKNEQQRRAATQALLACPTGSIGCDNNNIAKEVIHDFPLQLEDEVYYCGFNSPKSYGGNAYLIEHPDGNWLVDSPKFNTHLVKDIERRGGLKFIFLTHEDDVADANEYAEHFGAKRIIHTDALRACREAEIVLNGERPNQSLPSDFIFITTPGHTKGHVVLLYKNNYLFTGDHLYFNRYKKRLGAFKNHCWYSWEEQTESMKKLLDYNFEWVLPGHGERVKLPVGEMREQLRELTLEMSA